MASVSTDLDNNWYMIWSPTSSQSVVSGNKQYGRQSSILAPGFSDDESTIRFDYLKPPWNPLKNPEREAKTLALLLLSKKWEE